MLSKKFRYFCVSMLNARDIVNQFLSILSSYFSIEENNGLGTSVLTTRPVSYMPIST